jgi:hypothetical protein
LSPYGTIAACIAYYQCADHIEEAIQSLLNQTVRLDEIYIVCDGDPLPPWNSPLLRDPRIRMIEFDASMGPFFAIDTVMRVSKCDFVLVQDADDWSSHSRASQLRRELMTRPQLVAATSAQLLHEGERVTYESLAERWCSPFSLDTLGDRFRHHALYRREQMLLRGGYFGGFKYAFDAYLTGTLYLTNSVSMVSSPLYNRRIRAGSLTRSAETGIRTPRRDAIAAKVTAMTAELAGPTTEIDPVQIARMTTRFLPEECVRLRDELATSLRYADLTHPRRIAIPDLLRNSLIQ